MDGQEEDEDEEDPQLGMLSEDDEPNWLMGTISKTVQHRIEQFQLYQLKLAQLTQPGWEDASNYCCERENIYGMTEWKVPALFQPQTEDGAASSALMTYHEPMETIDSVTGEAQMPHETSQPGSIHMRLRSWKP